MISYTINQIRSNMEMDCITQRHIIFIDFLPQDTCAFTRRFNGCLAVISTLTKSTGFILTKYNDQLI